MSSSNIAPAKKQTFSVAISTESYQNLIRNTLKDPKRANRFIASITSAVATTPALQTCEPSSILAGGLLGEALNLSPSPQLGQYYLVPFKQKAKYDREGHLLSPECSKAQFVLGYKGYVQLALRSGQYSDLDCMEIRQGEYLGKDPHTAKPQFKFIEDDDLRESLPIVGYMAYFEYLNGFRKCIYWSREKMLNHADTYSQAFSKDAYDKIQNGQIADKDIQKLVVGLAIAPREPTVPDAQRPEIVHIHPAFFLNRHCFFLLDIFALLGYNQGGRGKAPGSPFGVFE